MLNLGAAAGSPGTQLECVFVVSPPLLFKKEKHKAYVGYFFFLSCGFEEDHEDCLDLSPGGVFQEKLRERSWKRWRRKTVLLEGS